MSNNVTHVFRESRRVLILCIAIKCVFRSGEHVELYAGVRIGALENKSEVLRSLESPAGHSTRGGERPAGDIRHSNKPPTLYPPIRVPFNVCASSIGMHVSIGSLLM